MSKPDRVWARWLAAVAVSFGVLEWRAYRRPDYGHTLTATSKRWLGIRPRRPWRVAGTAGLVGALAWLAVHIVVDGGRQQGA